MHRTNPFQGSARSRISSVFLALCEHADSPTSLAAWLLFKYGEYIQLVEKEIDPKLYDNPTTFALNYGVCCFLKKYTGFTKSSSLRSVALSKFDIAEVACSHSNDRFLSQIGINPALELKLFHAQRKASEILGFVNLDEIYSRCRHGPGSTFSLSGDCANWDDKIREDNITVTAACYPFLKEAIQNDYHLARARGINAEAPFSFLSTEFSIVRGNRITVVPKNAKTDRTIGIEPSGNIFLQLGIGSVIRSQLKRYGVNLDDQTRNQELARIAHKASLATIDLSMASDTVSLGLVLSLLPPEWAELLDKVRSREYLLDGSWNEYEKFSAMGNGFTFELESLLFYSLVCAIVPKGELYHCAVYGDDIIVPQRYAPELIELLSYCGFSCNKDKTFIDGCFFESCGKHYFRGFEVTPIYQKEVPNDEASCYRLANRISRYCYRLYGVPADDRFCPQGFRLIWFKSIKSIPIKAFSPFFSFDDFGLAVQRFPFTRKGDRIFVPSLIPKKKLKKVSDESALAYTLRFEPREPVTGSLELRSVPRYRYGKRTYWTSRGVTVST